MTAAETRGMATRVANADRRAAHAANLLLKRDEEVEVKKVKKVREPREPITPKDLMMKVLNRESFSGLVVVD